MIRKKTDSGWWEGELQVSHTSLPKAQVALLKK